MTSTPLEARLFSAASSGLAEVVAEVMKAGADPHQPGSTDGMLPIHQATINGHTRVVELLATAGGARSLKAPWGSSAWTPLHLAALHNHPQTVQALLSAGADPNARAASGTTPLHFAALIGNVDITRALLDRGATVAAQDANNATPLGLAANKATALLLLGAFGDTPQATAAVQQALTCKMAAGGDQEWDVFAVLLKEVGRRAPHALVGILDELQQDQCGDAAAAIVRAWLQDVSFTEQQQAALQEQRVQLQETKAGLQHLFVAAAAAVRNQAGQETDGAGGGVSGQQSHQEP